MSDSTFDGELSLRGGQVSGGRRLRSLSKDLVAQPRGAGGTARIGLVITEWRHRGDYIIL